MRIKFKTFILAITKIRLITNTHESNERNFKVGKSSALDIKEILNHDKYLGLLTVFFRSKKFSFEGLRDRIWKILQGWKEKLLSKASKEVLIKVVAHSISTYGMSCFKLPNSFYKEVESIICNFRLGTSNSECGIPCKAWKKVCRLKCEGGLGFWDLKMFNDALLTKKFWRFHCYPNSLSEKSLKAKYFPLDSIWRTKVGYNPSFAWRSIWSVTHILEAGSRCSIGNGRNIRFWKDA